jgi:GTP-binding protein YchF
MGFICGIVGLPNTGKSTIFNALTSGHAPASNYPFCTIEPNKGIVAVPDKRLSRLAEIIHPPEVTPTTLEFHDVAGLVKGASHGEGLGNQFLGHIRTAQVIAHVVGCFEHQDVAHVYGSVDPKRDIEIVNTELILADLETLEKKIAKTEKVAKQGDKTERAKMDTYTFVKDGLDRGTPVRALTMESEQKERLRDLFLLTEKPVVYVANADEKELKMGQFTPALKQTAEQEGAGVVVIAGKIESEIAQLEEDERILFRQEMGVEEPGLERLIHVGYHLLNLVTFYTTVGPELRAWTVLKGTRAPQAAGRIHGDMEKGFVKAEVISFEGFVEAGSAQAARESGHMRIEGKEYPIEDGDVVYFRFA